MPHSENNGLRYAHGIVAVNSRHPGVRRLKRQGYKPSLHGNKVWRSSFALMAFFTDFPIPVNNRVLDIGCGWGSMGIFLAKTYQSKVLAIDADPDVAPYLKLQAELNKVDIDFQQYTIEQLTTKDLVGFHTVVGADICFWDKLVSPLYKMIQYALDAGVKQIIIGDPGRPPFWELVEVCSETLNIDVLQQNTHEPVKTSKHLLIIEP